MGFSPGIKSDALVAAARHCCVCHRYKGLKIVVHHIEQEANGGPNTFENAIPLCSDCHIDAGHYNIMHPIGTKFSNQELIKARDAWYLLVKENNILEPTDCSDDINIKYLICKNTDASVEIINSDFSDFPIEKPYLVNNEVLEYFIQIRNLLEKHNHTFNLSEHSFKDVHEYLKEHPDAIATDKSDFSNPYFECLRIPTSEELQENKNRISDFIKYLLKIGIEPKEFLKCVTYPEFCGSGDDGGIYYEKTMMRPLWFVFLHITNVSETQLTFETLKGNFCNNDKLFKPINDINTNAEEYVFKFPSIQIKPKEAIFVPLFMCFAPFDNLDENEKLISQKRLCEQVQEFSLNEIKSSSNDFTIIGKNTFPNELCYKKENNLKYSGIHELDFNRVYSINRHWQCGSCPHLFFQYLNGKLEYVKEIFTLFPNQLNIEIIVIPQGVIKLHIAELEDEMTEINSIKINGQTLIENILLLKGDTKIVNVDDFDKVEIIGTYRTDYKNRTIENLKYRNKIIGQYIKTVANTRLAKTGRCVQLDKDNKVQKR